MGTALLQHSPSVLLGDLLVVKRTHVSSNFPVKLRGHITDVVNRRDVLVQLVTTAKDAVVLVLGWRLAIPPLVAIKRAAPIPLLARQLVHCDLGTCE